MKSLYKSVCSCLLTFLFFTLLFLNPVFAEDYNADENGAVHTGVPENGRIYSVSFTDNKSMSVANGLSLELSNVVKLTNSGYSYQEWCFIKAYGDDIYYIKETSSGKYLTAYMEFEHYLHNGINLSVCSLHSNNNDYLQKWKVARINSTMRYRIELCNVNNTVTGYSIGTSSDNVCLQQNDSILWYVFLCESAPMHGLQEGAVHIQQYSSAYSTICKMIGIKQINMEVVPFASTVNRNSSYRCIVSYVGNDKYHLCLCYEGVDYYLSVLSNQVVCTETAGSNAGWFVEKDETDGLKYMLMNESGEYLYIFGNGTIGLDSEDGASIFRIYREFEHDLYDYAAYVIDSQQNNFYLENTFQYACNAYGVKDYDNQKLIYYTGENSPSGNQLLSSGDFSNLIMNSRFFEYNGHGLPNMICLDNILANGNASGNNAYELNDLISMQASALSSVKCVFFNCCYSANGMYLNSGSSNYTYSDSDNFVAVALNKGARAAIGYDCSVNVDKADTFEMYFFSYLSTHWGSQDNLASQAFIDTVTRFCHLESDFKPFFSNGTIQIFATGGN